MSYEHRERHGQGCRPGQVVAVVVPEGGSHVGYAAVLTLGFGNVACPFGIEVVVVEEESLAETPPCAVAKPRLTLITLRAVDGHALVVGEDAPAGILVHLI